MVRKGHVLVDIVAAAADDVVDAGGVPDGGAHNGERKAPTHLDPFLGSHVPETDAALDADLAVAVVAAVAGREQVGSDGVEGVDGPDEDGVVGELGAVGLEDEPLRLCAGDDEAGGVCARGRDGGHGGGGGDGHGGLCLGLDAGRHDGDLPLEAGLGVDKRVGEHAGVERHGGQDVHVCAHGVLEAGVLGGQTDELAAREVEDGVLSGRRGHH